MVGLVRIDKWPFLFESSGYYYWKSSFGMWGYMSVIPYKRDHDECLTRLMEW